MKEAGNRPWGWEQRTEATLQSGPELRDKQTRANGRVLFCEPRHADESCFNNKDRAVLMRSHLVMRYTHLWSSGLRRQCRLHPAERDVQVQCITEYIGGTVHS